MKNTRRAWAFIFVALAGLPFAEEGASDERTSSGDQDPRPSRKCVILDDRLEDIRLEEALDRIVPRCLKEGDICGAVIEVGKRNDDHFETWRKAYGARSFLPAENPMTCDALFDLASMTKPIATGTALMRLVEQRRMALSDPVGKYLPEFQAGEKSKVTIRHLMTHTSGMPPYVGAADQKRIQTRAGYPCPKAIRAYIRQLPLSGTPGEKTVYSCLNAILCAELVEVVSGQPLDQFVSERVFQPLKMNTACFNPPPELRARCLPSTRDTRPDGSGEFLVGRVHDPLAAMQGGVSGNAGLFAASADLGRFAQMLLNGGSLDGARILKSQTIREMTRVQNPGAVNRQGHADRRGLLWDLYVPDPGDVGVDALFAFGHTGYTGTAIRIYPEQGIYILVLANRVHPDDHGRVSALRRSVWSTVGEVLLQ